MKTKRLKVIFLWALVLAALSNGGAFLLGYVFGDQTLALLATLVLTVVLAAIVGYMAASALVSDPEYQKKWNLTAIGGSVALFSGLFTGLAKYFLNGQFDLNVGFIPIIMGAVGGYLVERKRFIRK